MNEFGLVKVGPFGERTLLTWATREETSSPYDVYFTREAPTVVDTRAAGGLANSTKRLGRGGSVWVAVPESDRVSVEPRPFTAVCPARAVKREPGLWEVLWD